MKMTKAKAKGHAVDGKNFDDDSIKRNPEDAFNIALFIERNR